jgi:hypothetical protein
MDAPLLSADFTAAGPAYVRSLICGQTRPAAVLGRFPTALYLRVDDGEVMALLTSDAVRLPIGLTLPTSSRELPLSSLSGPAVVGQSAVRVGGWTCRGSRTMSLQAPTGLTPDTRACAQLRARLARILHEGDGLPVLDVLPDSMSREGIDTFVGRLLGRGPGLTPAGDDVLAGLLVGLRSFRRTAEPLRSAVLAAASTATTDLSGALLRRAAVGEAIPQVSQVLRTMATQACRRRLDNALDDLLRVGHTSGAALAAGLLASAVGDLAHGAHSTKKCEPCDAFGGGRRLGFGGE